MKKLYRSMGLPIAMLLLFTSMALAQNRTVTGTITDENGSGMPGVNVIVKGTSAGTTTDSDGKYAIAVPEGNATLVVSFIGYATQEVEVGARTAIDVKLESDVKQLSEVVVTALGIERNTKALQSSVTQVSGDNFTQARENSMVNGLAGRVAGVNVTKIATGPAGSSRVVIRGAKSIGTNTNNQPLYVIDGIPMDNTNYGQAGVWGGGDQGDGTSSISPDDIQSMTILKGASAGALYGARAAQGVILITTKKGSARKGVGIEFNSNFVFEKIYNLTDWQHSYGSGAYTGVGSLANRVSTKASNPEDVQTAFDNGWYDQAWGPKLDGSTVYHFDGKAHPYSYQGDQWDKFYRTGTSFTNSLAFSGGSETQNFRFSMSNLNSKSVIPNSGFDRVNLSLASNSKFGKKLTLTTKIMYSNEKAKNRPNVSDSPGNGIQSVYYINNDYNIDEYKGDPNKPGAVYADGPVPLDGKSNGQELQGSSNLWGQNPYWAAYQFKNTDMRDRIIASGQLRYDITDFLYAQVKGGMDWSTKRGSQLTPEGTGYQLGGALTEYEARQREINLEYIVGFNKTYGKIGVNVFGGGNKMTREYEKTDAVGNGFNTPFLAAINNAASKTFNYDYRKSGINSLFGSAEISWNNVLYVTGTIRNDWFSVLTPRINSISYPSIGASFVFSDAFTGLPTWLSFGKVRASWGQVGSAFSVDPYSTITQYTTGLTHLSRPLGYYSSATTTNNGNLNNPDLVPYTSTETEFGLDVRFFENRLGMDLTYYSQKTTDDILNAPISRASGFGTTSVNLGQLTNKGVELLLTGQPLRGNLTWDVSLNFAKNNSKIVSLIPGTTVFNIEEPRTRTVYVSQIVGQPFGTLTGLKQRTTADGQLIYDKDGAPLTDNTYQILGSGVPNFTGGLNNSFTYKQFNLTFLIDFKSGGKIYSGTNVRMTEAGFHKQTLAGRDGEAPLHVKGVQELVDDAGNVTQEPIDRNLAPGEAQNYWSQLGERAQDHFVYDASFIKLRQVTFGYSIPKVMLQKTPFQTVSLSFVARNLAILYKNAENIDPESSYTSNNAQGLDYFGVPPTRTYGFNLRVTF
ncbi:TonB-linked outer membrane protein, SusC/RagA family [Chryseolinea serpens]|uniref:TonB-linked outer membrane protein, SusC/RagA family n=1 Tax=Chryseolinea serpens TaxID=947013 RepID=A0A1M5LJ20_9BACT|nr:SusC/RagA family TonB-linked outer membrane protein [Chryseolinea serpens]SHG65005.1 TonB-linked outer membrane protein, SusC/RagA family [Chryseolinea serpens]